MYNVWIIPMPTIVSWSSISLLHNVVRSLNIIHEDSGQPLPVVGYRPKVKLHGTNCAIQSFQVDFISCSPKDLISTYHYMSFNDVGNLLGKIFRCLGLKYGNRGLTYVFRRESNENYTHEIAISRDIDAICAFIGLDAHKWHAGFAELENIFDWVIASPYFSVGPYLDPKRVVRSRLRKRRTVARFVEYLNARAIRKTADYHSDRRAYLHEIAAHFPQAQLLEAVEAELVKERRDNLVAHKFNGKLVMRWLPTLTGPALGEFIQAFKKSLGDFDAAVCEMDADGVRARATAFYHEVFQRQQRRS